MPQPTAALTYQLIRADTRAVLMTARTLREAERAARDRSIRSPFPVDVARHMDGIGWLLIETWTAGRRSVV